jgi:hypothetical protein
MKRPCKWHGCRKGQHRTRALFEPRRRTQDFCSEECRRARAAWKERRGAVLVDMLLDAEGIEICDGDLGRARQDLIDEIDAETRINPQEDPQ